MHCVFQVEEERSKFRQQLMNSSKSQVRHKHTHTQRFTVFASVYVCKAVVFVQECTDTTIEELLKGRVMELEDQVR